MTIFKKDIGTMEYHAYHSQYISLAPELSLLDSLVESRDNTLSSLETIPESKYAYSYASGKWNLKEILLHLIDTEKIFVYRALRIARMDESSLLGYNHEEFVEKSGANTRSMNSLLEEYVIQRSSTILFFKNLEKGMLGKIGLANEQPLSPRAIAFIICGHEAHHLKIFKDKY